MKTIKYVGNLIRYEVFYKGAPHIFSESNNYTLDFEDDFAKELLQKSPNIFKEVSKQKPVETKEKEIIIENDVEIKEEALKKTARSK